MTIYFLKDLISGAKKKIYGKDVRHCTIPQYENTTIKDIADFVKPYDQVHYYLPIGREIGKLPKQWIANVCATVLKDVFTTWVAKQVKERNEKLVVKQGLAIEMDPEIAAAFNASTK